MLRDAYGRVAFRVLKHKTHLSKASRDKICFFISKPLWWDEFRVTAGLQEFRNSNSGPALFQQVARV